MLSYSGQYTGNGGASQSITGLPFTPDIVIIKAGNDSTQDSWFRTKEMPAGLSITVRSDSSFGTNRIISLDTNGFTVGNQIAVNQSSYPFYYWIAKDNGLNDFSTIFFEGNGADDYLVWTAWQPDYSFLKSEYGITGCRKWAGMGSATGNQNSNLAIPNYQGASPRTDLVYFGSEGMRVSNGSNSGGNLINSAGYGTYGFVMKNNPGYIYSGNYTGTGAAMTVTTGVPPIFIDVQSNGNNNPTIQFAPEQSGGLTSAWDSATSTGKIPSVTAAGFNVTGTDPNVNTSGTTYWQMSVAQRLTPTVQNITGPSTIAGIGTIKL